MGWAHGFPLATYQPKTGAQDAQLRAVQETFAAPFRSAGEAVLPRWCQRAINYSMFDPLGDLGPGGAHTPLLGQLGRRRGQRTEAALVRREMRATERRQRNVQEKRGW